MIRILLFLSLLLSVPFLALAGEVAVEPGPSLLEYVGAGILLLQVVGWFLARLGGPGLVGKIGRWLATFPANVGLPKIPPPSGLR